MQVRPVLLTRIAAAPEALRVSDYLFIQAKTRATAMTATITASPIAQLLTRTALTA